MEEYMNISSIVPILITFSFFIIIANAIWYRNQKNLKYIQESWYILREHEEFFQDSLSLLMDIEYELDNTIEGFIRYRENSSDEYHQVEREVTSILRIVETLAFAVEERVISEQIAPKLEEDIVRVYECTRDFIEYLEYYYNRNFYPSLKRIYDKYK